MINNTQSGIAADLPAQLREHSRLAADSSEAECVTTYQSHAAPRPSLESAALLCLPLLCSLFSAAVIAATCVLLIGTGVLPWA